MHNNQLSTFIDSTSQFLQNFMTCYHGVDVTLFTFNDEYVHFKVNTATKEANSFYMSIFTTMQDTMPWLIVVNEQAYIHVEYNIRYATFSHWYAYYYIKATGIISFIKNTDVMHTNLHELKEIVNEQLEHNAQYDMQDTIYIKCRNANAPYKVIMHNERMC